MEQNNDQQLEHRLGKKESDNSLQTSIPVQHRIA
jgi:hypothetical protein